jgi:hypothetical protein
MALIQIFNDANTVLIDDNYSNACVAIKAAITLVPGATSTAGLVVDAIDLTYSSTETPMLAIELSDIKVASIFTTRSGNTWTFRIFFHKDYYNRSLNYWIFNIPSAVQSASGILQLFDATGKLVFDSNLKYMRIFRFYQTPKDTSTIASDLITGRSYAAINVVPYFYRQHIRRDPSLPGAPYSFIDGNAVGIYSRSGNSLLSTLATTYQSINNSDNPVGYVDDVNNGRLMLIDVTGY